jgi:hypothetical protein
MTFYETIDGDSIPLSILTREEQSIALSNARHVQQNIEQLTRTRLQYFYDTFYFDSIIELKALQAENDCPITAIFKDLRERIAVTAGFIPEDEYPTSGVRAKGWTGKREGYAYVFSMSADRSEPSDPLVFNTDVVAIRDSAEHGFRAQTEKKERALRREPLSVTPAASMEMNSFLLSLRHEYGHELDEALRTLIKLGYDFGHTHAFASVPDCGLLKREAWATPFVRRLRREVGSDVYGIVNHAVMIGLHAGHTMAQEGLS